jgi:hypothetical protein
MTHERLDGRAAAHVDGIVDEPSAVGPNQGASELKNPSYALLT